MELTDNGNQLQDTSRMLPLADIFYKWGITKIVVINYLLLSADTLSLKLLLYSVAGAKTIW